MSIVVMVWLRRLSQYRVRILWSNESVLHLWGFFIVFQHFLDDLNCHTTLLQSAQLRSKSKRCSLSTKDM